MVLPGTPVKADTVIMELSNPQVEQEALNADLDLRSAEAEYHNTKAKIDSDLASLAPARQQLKQTMKMPSAKLTRTGNSKRLA